ncbi:hypothetical protein H1Q63_09495 [Desmonostoc muscorum CCALA 125]|nr:hypothetical protein [Desmonostoc muscorum CCALA 125]
MGHWALVISPPASPASPAPSSPSFPSSSQYSITMLASARTRHFWSARRAVTV